MGLLWPASHASMRSRLLTVAGAAKEQRVSAVAAERLRNVRRFMYVGYRFEALRVQWIFCGEPTANTG